MYSRTEAVPRRADRRAPRRRARRASRYRQSPAARAAGVVGELVLTAGVLVLLYVVYVLWGTGIHADMAQDDLRQETLDAWSGQTDGADEGGDAQDDSGESADDMISAGGEVDLGDGYAFLRIPRFGADWEWVVVEGTKLSDLSRGPGHYADSADVGEIGNFSIAGHRSGYGAPFAGMHNVQLGDRIEVETADGTYVYTVDQAPVVIEPTETWVIDPVPAAGPEADPTERRLTLTTCHPRYGSEQRMYVSAVLTSSPEV